MIKKILYLTTVYLIFVFSVFSQKAAETQVKITFLHVNDVYQFMPVDGGDRGGLARLLTLKKKFVTENPNTIFTLGGDTISPSVETRTYKGAQMIDAWNAVGIDYAVFGNHEFDVKSDVLLQRMKESKFQWLGTNVFDKKTNKIFADLPPFVIREIGGVKIGIIGFLLPETKQTSSMEENLEVQNFCQLAKKYVPMMRKKGANTIIGLTHLSMSQDKQLAKCADFDLILGGHEHSLLQSASNHTPIFKMTADARELGRFDLFINKKTGRLEEMDWEIVPVTNKIEDAPEFAAVVDKYKDLLQKLAEPIGMTGVELDATSFSNRNKETNIGNFVADSYRNAVGADVALVNGGSIRADLTYNVGMLTKRDVLSILPFNNPIVKVEITGKTLREVLEHGVARSAEEAEAGRFPQISGMSFTFDVSKPAGNRVTGIKVGGQPLNESKTYTLATSDFLVTRGGDGYTMFKDAKVLITADKAQKDSDVFEKAIKDSPNSTISPKVEGRITRIGQK
ncbi:MAG TPA: 5'-nucleotidase C-terminal domain-containing protein [Pyrinomonadaceae bacterium]|nr:5'-nucleotidase C-terminal domain-containing protein [Pyrinomonadaceae bacterium]